jgi:hypothetical protein
MDPRAEQMLLSRIDRAFPGHDRSSFTVKEVEDLLLDLRLCVQEVAAFDWSVVEPGRSDPPERRRIHRHRIRAARVR